MIDKKRRFLLMKNDGTCIVMIKKIERYSKIYIKIYSKKYNLKKEIPCILLRY